MPSLQSSYDDEGIAAELAESQQAISIAEFFEKNKHMLGFDSGARGLVTAVKEAVDNALDAAEEAGHLPDIYIEIEEVGDYYRLVVEDNGPGITAEELPKVFGKLLYGSRFHKNEQTRGQQGIGISAAVLYSQLTSGKPAKITSRPRGSENAKYFELIIDTDTNEPDISVDETTSWDRPHGTRIELEMEANMRARSQLRDYIKHTAVVNPHARIELREPGGTFKAERATEELPTETEEISPHPHGVELGTVLKMLDATDSYSISGFLQEEFTRVGQTTATKVIAAFNDRYYGREIAWQTPDVQLKAEVNAAVVDAVARKGQEPTEAFASRVADVVVDRDRLAYHELEEIVETAGEATESETGTIFGETVCEKTSVAVWAEIRKNRSEDLLSLVDAATSTRKDATVVKSFTERLAAKFSSDGDGESESQTRDRLRRDTLREYVDRAAEMTQERDDVSFGETSCENIVEEIWDICRGVPAEPPKVTAIADDRDIASVLLEAMRRTDIIAPPTDCLSPITADLVRSGLKKEFDADFYASATRDAGVHGGDPFVVEAGIAYGGEVDADGGVELLRFANRVPLVYQRGACVTTDVLKDIGWRNYELDQPGGSGLPSGPAVIMIHVASTNVPFTSESKDAMANVPAIKDEIELAVREAARDLKSYLKKRQSLQQRQQKQNVLGSILPEMADKLADVTDREALEIDDSLARIMNNVLVERRVDDETVKLVVENNSGKNASPEITDIVSTEPSALSNGAQTVEMDGEWYVKWSPDVESDTEEALEYEVSTDADSDLDVTGVDREKLTVNSQ